MRTPRTVGALLIPALSAAMLVLGMSPAHAATSNVLYVSATGSDSNPCTRTEPCATIGHAVSVSRPSGTISVGAGTYAEDVIVPIRLHLVGTDAIVDATNLDNGFLVTGQAAAGTSISGFTVENAYYEGVLVLQTSSVSITDNQVLHNDQGMFDPNPQGECAPQGEIPGDCGEGIHLMTASGSMVARNLVQDNSGGILLTDEFGPTAHNVIMGNTTSANLYDCGITIAGHNPGAVDGDGNPQPQVAGVYGNHILGNTSDGNGTLGEGAGILMATAGPGTGVYDNMVVGNEASGNGLSGVTMHSHAPGDDLNGNQILSNTIGQNNLVGDPDAGDFDTTGILVFSAVTELSGTLVRGNKVSGDYYGIWTQNVPTINVHWNAFTDVTVPVHQQ